MRPITDPMERINRLLRTIQGPQMPVSPISAIYEGQLHRLINGPLFPGVPKVPKLPGYTLANTPSLTIGAVLGRITGSLYAEQLSGLSVHRVHKAIGSSSFAGLGFDPTQRGLGKTLERLLKPPLGIGSDRSRLLERLSGSRYLGQISKLNDLTALGPLALAFSRADVHSPNYLQRIAGHIVEGFEAELDYLEGSAEDTPDQSTPEPLVAISATVLERVTAEIEQQFSAQESDSLTEQAQKALKQTVAVLLYLLPILSFLSDLYSIQGDNAFQEKLFRQNQQMIELHSQENDLLQQWVERDISQAAHKRYALNDAPLRQEPNAKSPKVGRIFPGQLLEELERNGNYVLISYFDFVVGYSRTGWVRFNHITQTTPTLSREPITPPVSQIPKKP